MFFILQREVELQQSEMERVQRELLELRAANRQLVEESSQCFFTRPLVVFRFSVFLFCPCFSEHHASDLAKAREGYVLKRIADEHAGELIQYQQETAEELLVVKIKAKECLAKATRLEKKLHQVRAASNALTQ